MDCDDQSDQLFDNLTFEFTLSAKDLDSDSDMSDENSAINLDSGQQTGSCTTNNDGTNVSSAFVNISLTQQEAASSVMFLQNSIEHIDNSPTDDNSPDVYTCVT